MICFMAMKTIHDIYYVIIYSYLKLKNFTLIKKIKNWFAKKL